MTNLLHYGMRQYGNPPIQGDDVDDIEKFDEGRWEQFEEELQTQVNTSLEEAFKVAQTMNPITGSFEGHLMLDGGDRTFHLKIRVRDTDLFQDDL